MKAKIPEESCQVVGCNNIIAWEITWHHHETNECNKEHRPDENHCLILFCSKHYRQQTEGKKLELRSHNH